MKKSAFTLIESMTALIIISAVGLSSTALTSAYLKTSYERDIQLTAWQENLNTAEVLRAEVHTLPQLYEFSQGKEIKISAVGFGVIELSEDGTFFVTEPENNMFSESLKSTNANIFKVEIGGSIPNTKITSVVILK